MKSWVEKYRGSLGQDDQLILVWNCGSSRMMTTGRQKVELGCEDLPIWCRTIRIPEPIEELDELVEVAVVSSETEEHVVERVRHTFFSYKLAGLSNEDSCFFVFVNLNEVYSSCVVRLTGRR